MEPRIASGSLCLFRNSVVGSRSGRTVLVEERKIAECAYTLKIYNREPSANEGERRGRILLKSTNRAQPDIEINEDGESQDQRFAIIAEFVQVMSSIEIEWVTPLYE